MEAGLRRGPLQLKDAAHKRTIDIDLGVFQRALHGGTTQGSLKSLIQTFTPGAE